MLSSVNARQARASTFHYFHRGWLYKDSKFSFIYKHFPTNWCDSQPQNGGPALESQSARKVRMFLFKISTHIWEEKVPYLALVHPLKPIKNILLIYWCKRRARLINGFRSALRKARVWWFNGQIRKWTSRNNRKVSSTLKSFFLLFLFILYWF